MHFCQDDSKMILFSMIVEHFVCCVWDRQTSAGKKRVHLCRTQAQFSFHDFGCVKSLCSLLALFLFLIFESSQCNSTLNNWPSCSSIRLASLPPQVVSFLSLYYKWLLLARTRILYATDLLFELCFIEVVTYVIQCRCFGQDFKSYPCFDNSIFDSP